MIMGLRIQNNVEAFNAHRQLTGTSAKAAKAMEKLSSGYRVNRAADDAAGLAISEKMRAQIGGLAQAQRNAQDAVSLVQTGEGALNEVHSMLQRVRDLKVQDDGGTLSTEDKKAIAAEVQQLGKEVSDIAGKTEFNGLKLLEAGTFTFTVGAHPSTITCSIDNGPPQACAGTYSPGAQPDGAHVVAVTATDSTGEAAAFAAASACAGAGGGLAGATAAGTGGAGCCETGAASRLHAVSAHASDASAAQRKALPMRRASSSSGA